MRALASFFVVFSFLSLLNCLRNFLQRYHITTYHVLLMLLKKIIHTYYYYHESPSLKRKKDYVTVAESIASENYVCKSMMTSLSSAALLIFLSCQSENIYYIENHS